MKVESPVFGALEVSADQIIEFPAGLPGFEDCRSFMLAHEEGATKILLLQSVDQPEVVFSVAPADALGVNYEFELSDDEAESIGLGNADDAAVAVIVRRRRDEPDSPANARPQANFMAPLVINTATRKGLQKVITRLGCDVTLRAQS